MLFRVRAALPDRPGALATLAARCGEAQVNILAVQIFSSLAGEDVTDELVLRVPDSWKADDLRGLVTSAGARFVSAVTCTDAALVDQPTRYVQAARKVLARPARFPEFLSNLLDAEPGEDEDHDVLEVTVGEVEVQISRVAPFTETERQRAEALAALVSDVLLANGSPSGALPSTMAGQPSYEVSQGGVRAVLGGIIVGQALVGPKAGEPQTREVIPTVDPQFRGRGIGGRLLSEAARLAASQGAAEIMITTSSDNEAVLPMLAAAGLRGRIRMSGAQVLVRASVRDSRP